MGKILLIFISFLAMTEILMAQVPYAWNFEVLKVSDQIYEIHCKATVRAPWHIYSQFTPDGGPLPTKFTFSKNPLYRLEGQVKENGIVKIKHEAAFGVDVKYFEESVDFLQRIRTNEHVKTNFSGLVEFMICNDQQCLPPTTQKFSVGLN